MLARIELFCSKAGNSRPPYPLETVLRIHLLRNWFALSDLSMEEAIWCCLTSDQYFSLRMHVRGPTSDS
ncbi:transposase [Azotobacter sp. CWF10]